LTKEQYSHILIVNMETLNLASALEMVGNEKDLLIELMQEFVKAQPLAEEKLIMLEKAADKTEAAKYVHFYKGAARQLGAEVLAASGQALEDVLRGKKEGNIDSLNKCFISDYKAAFDAINAALSIL